MNTSPGNPLIQQYGVFSHRLGFYAEPEDMLAMLQAWVRYTMNGETANGLCEHSTFSEQAKK